MKKKNFIYLILATMIWSLLTPTAPTLAEVSDIASTRQQLEQQLKDIEQQIAQYQKELGTIKGQKNTLNNKIKELQSQQAGLKLQIQATSLQIDDLNGQIKQTQSLIADNTLKTRFLQSQLKDLIQKIYLLDQRTPIFIFLMKNNLAEVFNEIQNYQQLSNELRVIIQQVKETGSKLNQASETLNSQWEKSNNLLSIKVLQQQQLQNSVSEQKTILQQTKGKESAYQGMVAESKKQIAAIKSRIYQLFNVGKQITFGQAVEIAAWTSQQTGVPTAFLLAILSQESNLGQNVGTCNRAGDPPEKGWKVIMKPTRDQEPFLAITKELGLDVNTTPVSCPMRDKAGNQVGWGGAMGPAQFIPSTWLGYKNKVSALTGKSPASPWDIRDAFVASALLLKANGAGTSRQSQWNAAMKYFSGSTNSAYSFYGDNVLALADKYQADIDKLNTK
ncbi:MAG: hypothetical protein WCX71_03220 [Candidatus Buchananbacteria bacterium]